MTTASTTSPTGLQQKLTTALAGAEAVLAKGSAIQISGTLTTQAQIITALEGYLEPFTDVATAKAAYAKAVAARTAEEEEAHEYLLALKTGLMALLGRTSPALAQFGMAVKQRTPPTAQTTMLAAAKRSLTRQLRGTLTKAQKAATKIVGTPDVTLGLTGTQIGPGVAAAAQSAALATAAAAGKSTSAAAAATSASSSTTATPAPVAPAPVASSTPSPALAAVAAKQS